MKEADIRRQRLRQWIDKNFDGKPARFAAAIGRRQPQIADLLDERKSFGEKLARKLEIQAGMPLRYLDGIDSGKDAKAIYHGVLLTRAGALFGAEWEKLPLADRIDFENELYARVAKSIRQKLLPRPEGPTEDPE